MADHLTEEEQIQALKDWWKHNWQSVVFPIVIVGAGYLGWNFWKDQTAAKAAAGAEQFSLLMEAVNTAPGVELTADQVSEAGVIATKLANEFEGSLYGDNANLVLARLDVDAGKLDSAQAYLQRVVDSGANRAIQDLAKTRLARLKLTNKEYDAAMLLVAAAGDSKYASQMAEVRGDILTAQGKIDAARTAYEEALKGLSPQDYQRSSLLQMKFDGVELLASTSSVEPVSTEAEKNVEAAENTGDESEAKEVEESAEENTAEASAENS
ncbi:MAG: tetratricopeptide repeat protein [Agarilytica sp.]